MHLFRILLCTMLCTLASSYALHCQDATLQWKRQIHRDAIRKLDFSPSGKYIAVVSRDSVSVCEAATGEVVGRYIYTRPDQYGDIIAIDAVFAPRTMSLFLLLPAPPSYDYDTMATAYLVEWNFLTGNTYSRATIQDTYDRGGTQYHAQTDYVSIARSPNDSTLAIGMGLDWSSPPTGFGWRGILTLYNIKTQRIITPIPFMPLPYKMQFSRTGDMLLYAGKYNSHHHHPGSNAPPTSTVYESCSLLLFSKDSLVPNFSGQSAFIVAHWSPIAISPRNSYVALRDSLYNYQHHVRAQPLNLESASDAVFLPNGNHILASLNDSVYSAGILEVSSNKWIARYRGEPALALALAHSATAFGTAHSNGVVALWDLPRGASLPVLSLHTDFTASDTMVRVDNSVQFHNRSYPLSQGVRFFWDFGDGTTSTEFEPIHIYSQPGTYAVQLAAYNLNERPDTTIKRRYIYVPELSPMVQWRKRYTNTSFSSAAFSADSKNIFTLMHGRLKYTWNYTKLVEWNIQTGDTSMPFVNVPMVACVPLVDGSLASYGSYTLSEQMYGDNAIQHIITLLSPPRWTVTDTLHLTDMEPDFFYHWDVGSRSLPLTGGAHLAASANGEHLIASASGFIFSQDGPLWDPVYDTITYGRLLHIDRRKDTMELVVSQDTAYKPVYALAVSPDGSTFAAIRDSLRLYSTETNQTLATAFVPYNSPLAFTSDTPPTLYIGTSVWKPNTPSPQPLPMRQATAFAFLPPGNRYLLSVFNDPDSCAAIYDTEHNQYVYYYTSHSAGLTAVAVSPDGTHFATSATDGSLTLWRIPEQFHPPTTSVADMERDKRVRLILSPNPSDGQNIHISFALSKPQQVDISIRDMMGTTVAQFQHNIQHAGTSTLTLPCSSGNIAAGVYICTIRSQDGMFSTPFLVLH